jgi:hypothetical protein
MNPLHTYDNVQSSALNLTSSLMNFYTFLYSPDYIFTQVTFGVVHFGILIPTPLNEDSR